LLLRNTTVNLASLVASLALALATTALLAKNLGPEGFGLLSLIRAIVGNVGLFEALFGSGVTRYVAHYDGTGETEARDNVVGVGVLVNLVQGCGLSLLAVAAAFLFFDNVFGHISAQLRVEGFWLLCVFFLVFVVQIVSMTLSRALEGLQLYPQIRLIETIILLLTFAALVVYFHVTPHAPLRMLAWIYLIPECLRTVIYFAVLRSRGMRLSLRGSSARWSSFKRLFLYGRPLLVAKLFTTLGYRGDALILGMFVSVVAVANYQVASQIWGGAIAGLAALTAALLPAISQRAARSTARVTSLFFRASRYSLVAAMAIGLLIVWSREWLIVYWVGPRYTPAELLIVLFMVQLVVSYHQGVSNMIALGTDTHHPVGKIEAFGSSLNLVLSLLLVRHMGAAGVIVAAIVRACVVTPLYIQLALHALELGWRDYLRECLVPAWRFFIGAAIAWGAVTSLRQVPVPQLAVVVVQGLSLCGVMALLTWRLVLEAEDRRRLIETVAR
jgi:O-antigen/teichoic acid export membrane protein